jgi:hypothetical protein
MAITYKLIGSTVLTDASFDIIFSSIPATYDNLELRISGRGGNSDTTYSEFRVWLNSQTTQSAQLALRSTNPNSFTNVAQNTGGLTYYTYGYPSFNGNQFYANTFSQAVITFPNYAQSTYKKSFHTVLAAGLQTDNASRGFLATSTYDNTSAITDIGLRVRDSSGNATTFVAGTSVYLYGIKNA